MNFLFLYPSTGQAAASSVEEKSMKQSSSEIATNVTSPSLSEKSNVLYNCLRLLNKTVLLYSSSLGRIWKEDILECPCKSFQA